MMRVSNSPAFPTNGSPLRIFVRSRRFPRRTSIPHRCCLPPNTTDFRDEARCGTLHTNEHLLAQRSERKPPSPPGRSVGKNWRGRRIGNHNGQRRRSSSRGRPFEHRLAKSAERGAGFVAATDGASVEPVPGNRPRRNRRAGAAAGARQRPPTLPRKAFTCRTPRVFLVLQITDGGIEQLAVCVGTCLLVSASLTKAPRKSRGRPRLRQGRCRRAAMENKWEKIAEVDPSNIFQMASSGKKTPCPCGPHTAQPPAE